MNDVEQFILLGSGPVIQGLVQVIAEDPEMEIVSVSSERIVARMPAARADLLRSALGGVLHIEPDEMLGPA